MDSERIEDLIFRTAPWLAAAVFAAIVLVVWPSDDEAGPGEADRQVAASSLPRAEGLSLLVVETESCGWCQRFNRDVAPGYRSSDYSSRAPLRSVHLRDQRSLGYRLAAPVRSVPTFILVDGEGREVDRVSGYPGAGPPFYNALDRMLAKAERGVRAVR